MKLTAQLKNWLVKNLDVESDASDEEFKKAAGEALASEALSVEKFKSLSSQSDGDDIIDGLASTLSDLKSLIQDLREDDAAEKVAAEKVAAEKAAAEKAAAEKAATERPAGDKAAASDLEKMVMRLGMTDLAIADGADASSLNEERSFSVRVKEAAERYSTTKKSMTFPLANSKGKAHPLAGQAVLDFSEKGRVIDEPSELDKAVAGAYAKFLVNKSLKKSATLAFMGLPQHDKELVYYAMEKMLWGGSTTGDDYADINARKLTSIEQKALIDDAVSGGLEAAPIVFDDQVIQTPLLHGELFPSVTVKPLERGRRVEGVSTGTVTSSWGGVDDTEIALFNTASYVSAFDTTIFRWEGAIRIGLDFLSDTPIDFGAHVTSQYGERLLEDLDDVIATGDGTTQPEGVAVKSGTTSISFGGVTSLGNYESLRFGVAKPEHRSNLTSSAMFCGTETSYQRARAIPVGASDARRLGGMDYSSYNWMERKYAINESLSNQQIFYAILARYRMYRRRGLTIRSSTEGDTLIRRNEMLLVAMARYGGQLERGACAAVTSDAPA